MEDVLEHKPNPYAAPRPTRQGFVLKQWPLEHLAYIYAVWQLTPSWSWKKRFDFLVAARPDIAEQYPARNGRPLTPNHLSNRVDKANRYGEVARYVDLLPVARAAVEQVLDAQAKEQNAIHSPSI